MQQQRWLVLLLVLLPISPQRAGQLAAKFYTLLDCEIYGSPQLLPLLPANDAPVHPLAFELAFAAGALPTDVPWQSFAAHALHAQPVHAEACLLLL